MTSQNFTRRRLLVSGLAFAAAGGVPALAQSPASFDSSLTDPPVHELDPALVPPPESVIDFPIEPVDQRKIPEQFRRQVVRHDGPEWPGNIIVDPDNRFLYLVLEDGLALRYGVGVGREGFGWSGEAYIALKRRWPRWVPPAEMVARDPNAAKWPNGMPGGPENPLGARALYLYQGNVDTLYRIHGTNDPSSIGKAMSSGCIRMLNEDIAELFPRVPIGTRVIVRQSIEA